MSDRAIFLAYRLGAGLLAALPEPVIRHLGRTAGRMSWYWSKDRKSMALRHMGRVLGQENPTEVRKAAREMFAQYGRYWAETLWFRPRRADQVRARLTLEGRRHLRKAQAENRPIIVALPHMGNWEMAGALSDEVGVRITAVAEALENQRIADWFVSLRAQLSIQVILAKGPSTIRALLTAIRDGRLVALVADRNIGGKGVEVDFFGERTSLPAGPAVLALRTRAVLLPCASYFNSGAGHRMLVLPPVTPPHPTAPRPAEVMTQELAHRFEELIRTAPTQWHLVQPNWPSDHRFLSDRSLDDRSPSDRTSGDGAK